MIDRKANMEEKQRKAGDREKRADRRETDIQIDKQSLRGRVRDRKYQMKVTEKETEKHKWKETHTHTHTHIEREREQMEKKVVIYKLYTNFH